MVENTSDTIRTAEAEEASTLSPTRMFTWETGDRTSSMLMVSTSIQTAKNTKESSSMARSTAEAPITIEVEPSMMESGTRIEKMDLVYIPILTVKSTKEIG